MASVTAAPCTISSSGIKNFSLPRAARANASSVTFVTSSRSASQTTAGPAIGLKTHLPKSRVRRSSDAAPATCVMTDKPVKFGTVTPELVAFAVQDFHYKDVRERIWALSNAFNEELHALADAGCPVIQMEEPQIHLLAARGVVDKVINPEYMPRGSLRNSVLDPVAISASLNGTAP